MINEESGCKVRFIPKLERHTGTRKERHSNVDNVSMFALRNDILLMCVRACHVIGDTYASEKLIQLLIFKPPPPPPPTRLHGNYLFVKEILNMLLEHMKLSEKSSDQCLGLIVMSHCLVMV
jgi:hypothetical protein